MRILVRLDRGKDLSIGRRYEIRRGHAEVVELGLEILESECEVEYAADHRGKSALPVRIGSECRQRGGYGADAKPGHDEPGGRDPLCNGMAARYEMSRHVRINDGER